MAATCYVRAGTSGTLNGAPAYRSLQQAVEECKPNSRIVVLPPSPYAISTANGQQVFSSKTKSVIKIDKPLIITGTLPPSDAASPAFANIIGAAPSSRPSSSEAGDAVVSTPVSSSPAASGIVVEPSVACGGLLIALEDSAQRVVLDKIHFFVDPESSAATADAAGSAVTSGTEHRIQQHQQQQQHGKGSSSASAAAAAVSPPTDKCFISVVGCGSVEVTACQLPSLLVTGTSGVSLQRSCVSKGPAIFADACTLDARHSVLFANVLPATATGKGTTVPAQRCFAVEVTSTAASPGVKFDECVFTATNYTLSASQQLLEMLALGVSEQNDAEDTSKASKQRRNVKPSDKTTATTKSLEASLDMIFASSSSSAATASPSASLVFETATRAEMRYNTPLGKAPVGLLSLHPETAAQRCAVVKQQQEQQQQQQGKSKHQQHSSASTQPSSSSSSFSMIRGGCVAVYNGLHTTTPPPTTANTSSGSGGGMTLLQMSLLSHETLQLLRGAGTTGHFKHLGAGAPPPSSSSSIKGKRPPQQTHVRIVDDDGAACPFTAAASSAAPTPLVAPLFSQCHFFGCGGAAASEATKDSALPCFADVGLLCFGKKPGTVLPHDTASDHQPLNSICVKPTLEQCVVQDAALGVASCNAGSAAHVHRTTLRRCHAAGFVSAHGDCSDVRECRIQSCRGDGAWQLGGSNSRLFGNDIEGNAGAGVVALLQGPDERDAYYAESQLSFLEENSVRDNKGGGIRVLYGEPSSDFPFSLGAATPLGSSSSSSLLARPSSQPEQQQQQQPPCITLLLVTRNKISHNSGFGVSCGGRSANDAKGGIGYHQHAYALILDNTIEHTMPTPTPSTTTTTSHSGCDGSGVVFRQGAGSFLRAAKLLAEAAEDAVAEHAKTRKIGAMRANDDSDDDEGDKSKDMKEEEQQQEQKGDVVLPRNGEHIAAVAAACESLVTSKIVKLLQDAAMQVPASKDLIRKKSSRSLLKPASRDSSRDGKSKSSSSRAAALASAEVRLGWGLYHHASNCCILACNTIRRNAAAAVAAKDSGVHPLVVGNKIECSSAVDAPDTSGSKQQPSVAGLFATRRSNPQLVANRFTHTNAPQNQSQEDEKREQALGQEKEKEEAPSGHKKKAKSKKPLLVPLVHATHSANPSLLYNLLRGTSAATPAASLDTAATGAKRRELVGVLCAHNATGSFHRCAIEAVDTGVDVCDGADPHFSGCFVSDCTRCGVAAHRNGLGALVECRVTRCGVNVMCGGGGAVTLRGNAFTHARRWGLQAADHARCLAEKNVLSGNGGDMQGDALISGANNEAVLRGNRFTSSTEDEGTDPREDGESQTRRCAIKCALGAAAARVEGNTISGHYALGSIMLAEDGAACCRRNVIQGNVHGPGIYCTLRSRGLVEDTELKGCLVGAIVEFGANPVLRRCRVHSNVLTDVEVRRGGAGRFIGCTIGRKHEEEEHEGKDATCLVHLSHYCSCAATQVLTPMELQKMCLDAVSSSSSSGSQKRGAHSVKFRDSTAGRPKRGKKHEEEHDEGDDVADDEADDEDEDHKHAGSTTTTTSSYAPTAEEKLYKELAALCEAHRLSPVPTPLRPGFSECTLIVGSGEERREAKGQGREEEEKQEGDGGVKKETEKAAPVTEHLGGGPIRHVGVCAVAAVFARPYAMAVDGDVPHEQLEEAEGKEKSAQRSRTEASRLVGGVAASPATEQSELASKSHAAREQHTACTSNMHKCQIIGQATTTANKGQRNLVASSGENSCGLVTHRCSGLVVWGCAVSGCDAGILCVPEGATCRNGHKGALSEVVALPFKKHSINKKTTFHINWENASEDSYGEDYGSIFDAYAQHPRYGLPDNHLLFAECSVADCARVGIFLMGAHGVTFPIALMRRVAAFMRDGEQPHLFDDDPSSTSSSLRAQLTYSHNSLVVFHDCRVAACAIGVLSLNQLPAHGATTRDAKALAHSLERRALSQHEKLSTLSLERYVLRQCRVEGCGEVGVAVVQVESYGYRSPHSSSASSKQQQQRGKAATTTTSSNTSDAASALDYVPQYNSLKALLEAQGSDVAARNSAENRLLCGKTLAAALRDEAHVLKVLGGVGHSTANDLCGIVFKHVPPVMLMHGCTISHCAGAGVASLGSLFPAPATAHAVNARRYRLHAMVSDCVVTDNGAANVYCGALGANAFVSQLLVRGVVRALGNAAAPAAREASIAEGNALIAEQQLQQQENASEKQHSGAPAAGGSSGVTWFNTGGCNSTAVDVWVDHSVVTRCQEGPGVLSRPLGFVNLSSMLPYTQLPLQAPDDRLQQGRSRGGGVQSEAAKEEEETAATVASSPIYQLHCTPEPYAGATAVTNTRICDNFAEGARFDLSLLPLNNASLNSTLQTLADRYVGDDDDDEDGEEETQCAWQLAVAAAEAASAAARKRHAGSSGVTGFVDAYVYHQPLAVAGCAISGNNAAAATSTGAVVVRRRMDPTHVVLCSAASSSHSFHHGGSHHGSSTTAATGSATQAGSGGAALLPATAGVLVSNSIKGNAGGGVVVVDEVTRGGEEEAEAEEHTPVNPQCGIREPSFALFWMEGNEVVGNAGVGLWVREGVGKLWGGSGAANIVCRSNTLRGNRSVAQAVLELDAACVLLDSNTIQQEQPTTATATPISSPPTLKRKEQQKEALSSAAAPRNFVESVSRGVFRDARVEHYTHGLLTGSAEQTASRCGLLSLGASCVLHCNSVSGFTNGVGMFLTSVPEEAEDEAEDEAADEQPQQAHEQEDEKSKKAQKKRKKGRKGKGISVRGSSGVGAGLPVLVARGNAVSDCGVGVVLTPPPNRDFTEQASEDASAAPLQRVATTTTIRFVQGNRVGAGEAGFEALVVIPGCFPEVTGSYFSRSAAATSVASSLPCVLYNVAMGVRQERLVAQGSGGHEAAVSLVNNDFTSCGAIGLLIDAVAMPLLFAEVTPKQTVVPSVADDNKDDDGDAEGQQGETSEASPTSPSKASSQWSAVPLHLTLKLHQNTFSGASQTGCRLALACCDASGNIRVPSGRKHQQQQQPQPAIGYRNATSRFFVSVVGNTFSACAAAGFSCLWHDAEQHQQQYASQRQLVRFESLRIEGNVFSKCVGVGCLLTVPSQMCAPLVHHNNFVSNGTSDAEYAAPQRRQTATSPPTSNTHKSTTHEDVLLPLPTGSHQTATRDTISEEQLQQRLDALEVDASYGGAGLVAASLSSRAACAPLVTGNRFAQNNVGCVLRGTMLFPASHSPSSPGAHDDQHQPKQDLPDGFASYCCLMELLRLRCTTGLVVSEATAAAAAAAASNAAKPPRKGQQAADGKSKKNKKSDDDDEDGCVVSLTASHTAEKQLMRDAQGWLWHNGAPRAQQQLKRGHGGEDDNGLDSGSGDSDSESVSSAASSSTSGFSSGAADASTASDGDAEKQRKRRESIKKKQRQRDTPHFADLLAPTEAGTTTSTAAASGVPTSPAAALVQLQQHRRSNQWAYYRRLARLFANLFDDNESAGLLVQGDTATPLVVHNTFSTASGAASSPPLGVSGGAGSPTRELSVSGLQEESSATSAGATGSDALSYQPTFAHSPSFLLAFGGGAATSGAASPVQASEDGTFPSPRRPTAGPAALSHRGGQHRRSVFAGDPALLARHVRGGGGSGANLQLAREGSLTGSLRHHGSGVASFNFGRGQHRHASVLQLRSAGGAAGGNKAPSVAFVRLVDKHASQQQHQQQTQQQQGGGGRLNIESAAYVRSTRVSIAAPADGHGNAASASGTTPVGRSGKQRVSLAFSVRSGSTDSSVDDGAQHQQRHSPQQQQQQRKTGFGFGRNKQMAKSVGICVAHSAGGCYVGNDIHGYHTGFFVCEETADVVVSAAGASAQPSISDAVLAPLLFLTTPQRCCSSGRSRVAAHASALLFDMASTGTVTTTIAPSVASRSAASPTVAFPILDSQRKRAGASAAGVLSFSFTRGQLIAALPLHHHQQQSSSSVAQSPAATPSNKEAAPHQQQQQSLSSPCFSSAAWCFVAANTVHDCTDTGIRVAVPTSMPASAAHAAFPPVPTTTTATTTSHTLALPTSGTSAAASAPPSLSLATLDVSRNVVCRNKGTANVLVHRVAAPAFSLYGDDGSVSFNNSTNDVNTSTKDEAPTATRKVPPSPLTASAMTTSCQLVAVEDVCIKQNFIGNDADQELRFNKRHWKPVTRHHDDPKEEQQQQQQPKEDDGDATEGEKEDAHEKAKKESEKEVYFVGGNGGNESLGGDGIALLVFPASSSAFGASYLRVDVHSNWVDHCGGAALATTAPLTAAAHESTQLLRCHGNKLSNSGCGVYVRCHETLYLGTSAAAMFEAAASPFAQLPTPPSAGTQDAAKAPPHCVTLAKSLAVSCAIGLEVDCRCDAQEMFSPHRSFTPLKLYRLTVTACDWGVKITNKGSAASTTATGAATGSHQHQHHQGAIVTSDELNAAPLKQRRIVLDELECSHCLRGGVSIERNSDVGLSKCHITNSGTVGVALSSAMNCVAVVKCIVSRCRTGVSLTSRNRAMLANSLVSDCDIGIVRHPDTVGFVTLCDVVCHRRVALLLIQRIFEAAPQSAVGPGAGVYPKGHRGEPFSVLHNVLSSSTADVGDSAEIRTDASAAPSASHAPSVSRDVGIAGDEAAAAPGLVLDFARVKAANTLHANITDMAQLQATDNTRKLPRAYAGRCVSEGTLLQDASLLENGPAILPPLSALVAAAVEAASGAAAAGDASPKMQHHNHHHHSAFSVNLAFKFPRPVVMMDVADAVRGAVASAAASPVGWYNLFAANRGDEDRTPNSAFGVTAPAEACVCVARLLDNAARLGALTQQRAGGDGAAAQRLKSTREAMQRHFASLAERRKERRELAHLRQERRRQRAAELAQRQREEEARRKEERKALKLAQKTAKEAAAAEAAAARDAAKQRKLNTESEAAKSSKESQKAPRIRRKKAAKAAASDNEAPPEEKKRKIKVTVVNDIAKEKRAAQDAAAASGSGGAGAGGSGIEFGGPQSSLAKIASAMRLKAMAGGGSADEGDDGGSGGVSDAQQQGLRRRRSLWDSSAPTATHRTLPRRRSVSPQQEHAGTADEQEEQKHGPKDRLASDFMAPQLMVDGDGGDGLLSVGDKRADDQLPSNPLHDVASSSSSSSSSFSSDEEDEEGSELEDSDGAFVKLPHLHLIGQRGEEGAGFAPQPPQPLQQQQEQAHSATYSAAYRRIAEEMRLARSAELAVLSAVATARLPPRPIVIDDTKSRPVLFVPHPSQLTTQPRRNHGTNSPRVTGDGCGLSMSLLPRHKLQHVQTMGLPTRDDDSGTGGRNDEADDARYAHIGDIKHFTSQLKRGHEFENVARERGIMQLEPAQTESAGIFGKNIKDGVAWKCKPQYV